MMQTGRAVHAHRPPNPLRHYSQRPSIAWFWRLLDHFGIDGDIDVITDDHAAVVQRGVPFHAEVLTIDF